MSQNMRNDEIKENGVNSYNVVFGKSQTTIEERKDAMKQIAAAKQTRGFGILIRKQHAELAQLNRQLITRKPVGPNKQLLESSEFRGAICAAEMTDKG